MARRPPRPAPHRAQGAGWERPDPVGSGRSRTGRRRPRPPPPS